MAARRSKSRRREPEMLCRALMAVSDLPKGDQLRNAARYRVDTLLNAAGGDTMRLAELLGVHVRSAQRLRVAFGVGR